MSVPFVGRGNELDVLASLMRRARVDRAPAAALITGEPGSGKSSLLRELLRQASSTRSIRVAGFEPMQSVPLAAVGDLLRHVARKPGEGAVVDRLVFRGAEAEDRDPLRIFEATHRALAPEGPMLIAIDDLQWVDDRSLALVNYLLRAAALTGHALVVVAAARPSPAAAAFRASIEADVPESRRAFTELGPLALPDARSLARAINRDLDDAGAAELWRRARGSPFWVEALARSRAPDADPAGLIGERLRALSADAGALLAALAVGARPFADEEAAGLLAWEKDRMRQAAVELVGRGLAVNVGGTLRTAHDLIREAAAGALPVAARRRLHARIGDWFEAVAGDDLPMLREALDHRVAAGLPGAALATRLLSSPRRRLMGGDDLRRLASISDGLDLADPERLQLDRGIAELAAGIGEVELALERWALVSEQTSDPSDRREAEFEATLAAYRFGRRAEAHEHLERARALPAASPEATVRLDALQADIELWLDHETAAGSRTAQRALAAAEEMTSTSGGLERLQPAARRAYLAALETAIDGAMQEDRDDEIIGLAEQCVRVAASLDDESHIAAQIRAAQALRTVARPREGESLDRQAWEASKRRVLPALTVEAGRGLARVLRDLGRLTEAHAVAVETRDLEARLTAAPRHWGSAASLRHVIELSFDDAAAALRAIRRDAEAEPDPHYRQDLHLAIAVWQARVGGAKAAGEVDAELAAAQADAELARCPRHSAGLALATAETLARIGRVAEARRALAEWDRRPGTGRVSRDLWRMRAASAIAAADGDDEAATSILEIFTQSLERAGLSLELIWARIDLGRSLARLDRDRAVAVLTSAAELAERCGATTEGRLIAQALRRLGVRAWRRGARSAGSGSLAGLSEREREIAAHVAGGSSNREIAEALVVSPKTVERHVTNILAKLGLRNRTEVASLIRSGPVRVSPDE